MKIYWGFSNVKKIWGSVDEKTRYQSSKKKGAVRVLKSSIKMNEILKK